MNNYNIDRLKNLLCESRNRDADIPFEHSDMFATYQSFSPFLCSIIKKFSVNKMLEWGPGFSTWISLSSSNNIEVFSYEGEEKWATYYRDMFTSLYPDLLPRLNFTVESDKDKYVTTKFNDAEFDLILVDGRERQGCLDRSFDLMKDDGILLLHDSQRKTTSMNNDMVFIGTHIGNAGPEETDVWVKGDN